MRTRKECRKALAAVEAALLVPLVLLILLGVIEYGWMFLKGQQIANAARHGARIAILESASTAQVQGAVATLMADADLDGSGYTLTITPGDVSAAEPGATVTVTITVPYAAIGITGAPLLPQPTSLRGSTSMAKEGPH
jgi:Flp pilus assembly protein TadG